MAGIGFSLRSAYVGGTLVDRLSSLGHATVVATGPWLFAIASLGLISITAEQVSELVVLAEFRAAVIYAFLLSLVAVSPVIIVSTRMVADALYASRLERIIPAFHGAIYFGMLPVGGLAVLIFFGLFRVPVSYGTAAIACTLTVAMIWITMAFCGTVKDYHGITRAFLIGLALAVIGTVAAAILGYGRVHMIVAFTAGLSVTLVLLAERILATFGNSNGADTPIDEVQALWSAMSRHAVLAGGALIGALAIWIDKWVVWWSPLGETLPAGLRHAPIYDSAMFVAYLAIIPSLATFVITLETSFFERYRAYFRTILSRSTLRLIEARRAAMEAETVSAFNRAIVIQLALSALVIVYAPTLVELLNLDYRQVSILQFGVIGATFQFVFFVASTIILFFDRQWLFLSLQALALALNGGLTALFLLAGPDYLGFGYLLAFVTAGLAAYLAMVGTLRDLNYLSFIGNNPAA